MDFLDQLHILKTMPDLLKKIITQFEEKKRYTFLDNKETVQHCIDWIYSIWKAELASMEEQKEDELTKRFEEIDYDYSVKDISTNYYYEHGKDTDEIKYRIEGVRMVAPFPYYTNHVIVLAKFHCQNCRSHFLGITFFDFTEHYLNEPICQYGYSAPRKEFPLTAIGFLEATKYFTYLLRLAHLAKWQNWGKDLQKTFKGKKQIENLKSTGQYSELFLAKDFPLDLSKEIAGELWGRSFTDEPIESPHSKFESFKTSKTSDKKEPENNWDLKITPIATVRVTYEEPPEKTDKKGKVNQNE